MVVLSVAGFDATTIDVSTARFGVDGGNTAPTHNGHVEDVNGDGGVDLLLHFQVSELGIDVSTVSGSTVTPILTAETSDGSFITGSDEVVVVPPNGNPNQGQPQGQGDAGGKPKKASSIFEPSSVRRFFLDARFPIRSSV